MSVNPWSSTYYTGGGATPGVTYSPQGSPTGSVVNYDNTIATTAGSAATEACPASTHWLGTPATDPELPALLAAAESCPLTADPAWYKTRSRYYWIAHVVTAGYAIYWLSVAYEAATPYARGFIQQLAEAWQAQYPREDLQNAVEVAHGDYTEDNGMVDFETFIENYLTRYGYTYTKTSTAAPGYPQMDMVEYTAKHSSSDQDQTITFMLSAFTTMQRRSQAGFLRPAQPLPSS
jgi:hypothetical protein